MGGAEGLKVGPRRFLMAAPVRRCAVEPDPQARPPEPRDAAALAELLHAAQRGTIDDDGETLDDVARLIALTFAGEFGPLLWSASEVIERDGRLVATTLLTLWLDGPFVAFSITAPGHQRRGLARAGLQRTFNRLAAGDEPWLRLLVTEGNAPAEALYAGLGFVPVVQAA